jgi:hypothetical protein
MTDTDIHSCSYYCDRHACIETQRNELRDKLLAKEWVGLTDGEIFSQADNFGSFQYGDAQGLKRLEYARAIEFMLKEKNT